MTLPGTKFPYAPRKKVRWEVDPVTGCWNWLLSLDKHGYGQVRFQGHTMRAHRLTYEQLKGPIPEGKQLDHKCRNHRCVNPDHLEPVTDFENTIRGKRAKLDWEKVHQIRTRRNAGETGTSLARAFGVTHTQIYSIVNNKDWVEDHAAT